MPRHSMDWKCYLNKLGRYIRVINGVNVFNYSMCAVSWSVMEHDKRTGGVHHPARPEERSKEASSSRTRLLGPLGVCGFTVNLKVLF